MKINFAYSFKHCDFVQLQGFLGFNPLDSRTPWALDPGVEGWEDSGDGGET